eukprot:2373196-Rhodomonas_salina.1
MSGGAQRETFQSTNLNQPNGPMQSAQSISADRLTRLHGSVLDKGQHRGLALHAELDHRRLLQALRSVGDGGS